MWTPREVGVQRSTRCGQDAQEQSFRKPRPEPGKRSTRRRARRSMCPDLELSPVPPWSERNRETSRPVGRVLSFANEGATIHLGPPLPAASSGLPARLGRAVLERRARDAPCEASLLDLAPGGVYLAAHVTVGAGGLLHHPFTLTSRKSGRRSALCGTVPRVTPGRRYRPPCPVEPGPSSASPRRDPTRPPGRLVCRESIKPKPPPTHRQDRRAVMVGVIV